MKPKLQNEVSYNSLETQTQTFYLMELENKVVPK